MTDLSSFLDYTLINAQKDAISSISPHIFPRYRNNGTLGIYLCNSIHDSLTYIQKIASRIFNAAYSIISMTYDYFKRPLDPFFKKFYSINQINGKGQLSLISRKIEKFLGDNILFPLNTLRFWSTKEKIPYSKEKMSTVVDDVVASLLRHNQSLLNPPEKTSFEYRMQTVTNPSCNAFAIPGGKMVIFSQLIKEIAESIESNEIKETKIHFQDGSVVSVNLEGITLKDVLAAVIGHEMTHVASRHCLSLIFETLARGIFHLLGDSQETVIYLLKCFTSRSREYEADITGTYFAAKAGFDPRGALYLHQLSLSSHSTEVLNFLEKLEFFFAHPHTQKRLCSLFTAISSFSPESLHNRVSWALATNIDHDLSSASPAILTAERIYSRLSF
jgi:predicted Zn-dependent protease